MIEVLLGNVEWVEEVDLSRKEEVDLINANIIIGDHPIIVEIPIKFLRVESYL